MTPSEDSSCTRAIAEKPAVKYTTLFKGSFKEKPHSEFNSAQRVNGKIQNIFKVSLLRCNEKALFTKEVLFIKLN